MGPIENMKSCGAVPVPKCSADVVPLTPAVELLPKLVLGVSFQVRTQGVSQAPEEQILGCTECWGGLKQRHQIQVAFSVHNEFQLLRLRRKTIPSKE
jgi:hypothetical protein